MAISKTEKLIAEAMHQLEKSIMGYDVISEEVKTEMFDDKGELLNTKIVTKTKHIYIDPKDAIAILSRISPEFAPKYSKQTDSDNEDLSLDKYK